MEDLYLEHTPWKKPAKRAQEGNIAELIAACDIYTLVFGDVQRTFTLVEDQWVGWGPHKISVACEQNHLYKLQIYATIRVVLSVRQDSVREYKLFRMW